eukprot:scaffold19048_cov146-Isochrysis_galbana.AAC.2
MPASPSPRHQTLHSILTHANPLPRRTSRCASVWTDGCVVLIEIRACGMRLSDGGGAEQKGTHKRGLVDAVRLGTEACGESAGI